MCGHPIGPVPLEDEQRGRIFRMGHYLSDDGVPVFACPARDYARERLDAQIFEALRWHYIQQLRDRSPTWETDPAGAALFALIIQRMQAATTRLDLRRTRRDYQVLWR
jgi:hypothetical protein